MDTGIGRGGGVRRVGTEPEGEDGASDQPSASRPTTSGGDDVRLAQLARAVAHELNNMLMVVHGSAESLRDAATAGQPADPEVVEDLLGACERVAGLTRRLQAFGHRRRPPGGPAKLEDLLAGG